MAAPDWDGDLLVVDVAIVFTFHSYVVPQEKRRGRGSPAITSSTLRIGRIPQADLLMDAKDLFEGPSRSMQADAERLPTLC